MAQWLRVLNALTEDLNWFPHHMQCLTIKCIFWDLFIYLFILFGQSIDGPFCCDTLNFSINFKIGNCVLSSLTMGPLYRHGDLRIAGHFLLKLSELLRRGLSVWVAESAVSSELSLEACPHLNNSTSPIQMEVLAFHFDILSFILIIFGSLQNVSQGLFLKCLRVYCYK